MKELFTVAKVLRPHGRRGEVVLLPVTDHPQTLMTARNFYIGQEGNDPVKVENIRLHKGRPLLKLAGIDSMNKALALKGMEICLPPEELEPLEEGEYFLHDLVGLTVLDHDGVEVGHVEGFMETGGPPLMVLTGSGVEDILIPFSEGTVDEVDMENEVIRLVDLPGLINV